MPKVNISNAKGLVQSTGSGGLNLDDGTINPTTMTAGSGVSSAAVLEIAHERLGSGLCKTSILVDLTGLVSSADIGDIIGNEDAATAHIGQITAARSGTIIGGRITCFETPAGGDDDIDLYAADESTGTEDAGIGALTETQLDDSGNHAAGTVKILEAFPTDGQYLYLVHQQNDADAAYTGGILLIELFGTM